MTLQGRIVRYQSGFYTVMTDERIVTCKIRGKLKENIRPTDLVAVGDLVEFTQLQDGTGVIECILPRKNELIRMISGIKTEYRQVLISNLDQILLVFAVAQPEPRLRMLDRFLVICEKQGIPPLIVANKIDLSGMDQAKSLFSVYSDIGYDVLYTSTVSNIGIADLKERLKGKITGLVGPSGVGKSSLINQIDLSLNLKVNEISNYNRKGKHTTVVREMFPLKEGGFVADLPGLKTLALWDIQPEELDGYFPEISPLVSKCLYGDCTHSPSEVGCAVHEAVKEGKISRERYESYLRIRFGEPE